MVEPVETRLKSKEGEEKKLAKLYKKKHNRRTQCSKASQIRCAGVTERS